MKIAVLISGEYRKFDITRKTMPFLDDPNIDVYVSTWNKTFYANKKINFRKEYDIDENIILKDLGRHANIKIDNFNSFSPTKYNSRMINRWLAGFELIRRSGIEYDYVVITRPDLFFHDLPIPKFDQIERYNNAIGFIWAKTIHAGKLGDIFFISTYENISKLFDNLTIDNWETATEWDWHIWWHKFIHNIFPTIINCEEFENVSFCRYWVNQEHNFDEMLKVYYDWRDLRLLDDIDLFGEKWLKNRNMWPPEVISNAKERWNTGYFDKYK